MGSGQTPTRTRNLALERIAFGLEPPGPTPTEELTSSMAPTELPEHEGGWTGRYLNGDRKVELTSGGSGLIYHTNVELLDVRPGTGGEMLATRRPSGQIGLRFQLVLDAAGRRYAILDGKAFIHEKDARVYPHGRP